jgi:hypothetical protein
LSGDCWICEFFIPVCWKSAGEAENMKIKVGNDSAVFDILITVGIYF